MLQNQIINSKEIFCKIPQEYKNNTEPVKKFYLLEMLSRIPKDYKSEEWDMGKPVGKEVW